LSVLGLKCTIKYEVLLRLFAYFSLALNLLLIPTMYEKCNCLHRPVTGSRHIISLRILHVSFCQYENILRLDV